VELDGRDGALAVLDEVTTTRSRACRLALHLGPTVDVELDGATARLRWTAAGAERRAELRLPAALTWSAHRGETDPPLGWYSPGFGRKEPSSTLVGRGPVGPGTTRLRTTLTWGT
jgi:hypothetical protein